MKREIDPYSQIYTEGLVELATKHNARDDAFIINARDDAFIVEVSRALYNMNVVHIIHINTELNQVVEILSLSRLTFVNVCDPIESYFIRSK